MTSPDQADPRRSICVAMALVLALMLAGASAVAATDGDPGEPVAGRISLYTSVTQDTVDAVLAALEETHPALEVDLYRAPSGDIDARIAAERRTGGIGADVLWMTDPLSIQRYDAEGLLAPLEGETLAEVPQPYRGDTFVGTRLLNLVIVAGTASEVTPRAWSDLTSDALADRVVIPDPGFAGSAFAALGYFATADDYGMAFYEALKDNGATQVASPGEVLTGVAEGRFDAGVTLDKIVRDALDKGSPVELIWPEPGAIALYSPAAVLTSSDDADAARAFVEFLVSPRAQAAIAGTGWEPVRSDVAWPYTAPAVMPDWREIFGRQQQLLESYRTIFGD